MRTAAISLLFFLGLILWGVSLSSGTSSAQSPAPQLVKESDPCCAYIVGVLGDILFFTAQDSSGPGFWKTDGTTTTLVKRIEVSSGPQTVAINNKLYFIGPNNELWITDGTADGTVAVLDGDGNIISNIGSNFGIEFAALNGNLFFARTTSNLGSELWKASGGTAELVKDINPYDPGGFFWGYGGSHPSRFKAVGSTLFFAAFDGEEIDDGVHAPGHGIELWKTDGTNAGTQLVKDITPGYGQWSEPRSLTEFNGLLYFSAYPGRQLWRSDGTEEGTLEIPLPNPAGLGGAYDPDAFTVLGNELLFHAWYPKGQMTNQFGTFTKYGAELFKMNTSEVTQLVKDLAPDNSSVPSDFAPVGNYAFFTAFTTATGYELWRTDGTANGTTLIKDINSGNSDSLIDYKTLVNGRLYFAADDNVHGKELWTSDGTPEGTQMVTDLVPGPNDSQPYYLTVAANSLFFNASGAPPNYVSQLWVIKFDDDNDGIPNTVDNCPQVANSDQADADFDAIGDACDPDDDNDGVPDGGDNCPFLANPDQANTDTDGIGNACDPDDDNDGVGDGSDNCPLVANSNQMDSDSDGIGDVCDPSTSAAISSSVNPSVYGQSVTFTATVISTSGTPGGSVQFFDGTTLLSTATLNNGSATLTTSALGAGSHDITAKYLGTADFSASTSLALLQTVAAPTPTGSNIAAQSSVGSTIITTTFASILNGGTTSVTPVDPNSVGTLPGGFELFGGSLAFEISTTAMFSPPITVCFQVPSINDSAQFSNLRVLHSVSKLDLAVANSGSNNASIRLGDGAGGFGAVTTLSAGAAPSSVAVGDFNRDDKSDIAVANQNSNNVSILLGNGLGGFGSATNFAVGISPRSVAVADFNNDGKLDLAVANAGSNNVSILIGNGSGVFGVATNYSVGISPRSVAVGDFNLDSKPDLVVANAGSDSVSVRLGDGAGSFVSATNFSVGTSPRSVAVGDFNVDGRPDLAVANNGTNNVTVRLGNGPGSFGGATTFSAGTSPVGVVIGNLNSDGYPDLVVVNQGSDNVSIRLGNGSGGFGSATTVSTGTSPRAAVLADFNNDNRLDLAVANSGSNNVSIRLGNGGGGFGSATTLAMGTSPLAVAVGNFNKDTVVVDQTILSAPNAPSFATRTICASVMSFSPFVFAKVIPLRADLKIAKTDIFDPVPLGNNIYYAIGVENQGPGTATGVTVTDTLPANVTFVSASAGCSHDSGTVTCTIQNLPNDDDVYWAIVVRPQTIGVFTNSATVAANEDDPNLSNNNAGAQTTVVAGIASVQLVPTCVKGGGIVNGTVTLSAPAPSGGAVVTLSSSNTSVARPTVNGNFVNSITIPAGQTTGAFTVKTFTVYSTKTVKIKATLNGMSKEATLTVVQYRCS